MKDRQASLETAVDSANRGDPPPARRRKWKDLEARLIRLKGQYVNGDRDLEDYWVACAHCIASFK
jgi:hypothetical protein